VQGQTTRYNIQLLTKYGHEPWMASKAKEGSNVLLEWAKEEAKNGHKQTKPKEGEGLEAAKEAMGKKAHHYF
jgi:hypothetical protein